MVLLRQDPKQPKHRHCSIPPHSNSGSAGYLRVICSWRWELLCICFVFGANCAIIMALLHFKCQIGSAWPFGINLSTLISVLSNISQASTGFSVAGALGQTKWHWFKKSHPLQHFTAFDSARASWIGSIKLLVIAPTSFLMLLSTITSIISLAVGPFYQQAIKFVGCIEPSSNSIAQLAITYSIQMRHLLPTCVQPATFISNQLPSSVLQSSLLDLHERLQLTTELIKHTR